MDPVDETLQGLQKELIDAEADIQAALHSMRNRVVEMRIVTHQRRDRPDEHGRPGFFRQDLPIPKHIEAVQARADQEKTTTSLNHKNWGSVINSLMEVSSGCVDDGNKIALRIDTLKNVLRTMHLLQRHLMMTSNVLPKIRETPAQPTPTPTPAVIPSNTVVPVIRKPTAVLQPTEPEGNAVTQDAPGEPLAELEAISFVDEPEHAEGDAADTQEEDPNNDEDDSDEESEGSWEEVL